MNNLQQFFNCRLLRDGKLINDNLWVRNGIIVDPEKLFFDEKVKADESIDCYNAIISPGYIDIQINGGFGVDFSYNVDNIEDGISKVAKQLLAHGVTSFCPTLVTSSPETYHKILPKIKKSPGGKHGATVLGVHVEGPFISPTKKGAHQEIYIKQLNKGFQSIVDVYGSLENICYLTLAPELDNSSEVIKALCERNIKVSLGHSVANLNQGENAVKSGASLITHLFNAMLPFHHRDPGLVGLLTSDQIPPSKKVYFGIISDGVHTHPAALRIAHRTHPEGLILVTDAISALGLQEGVHRLGQLNIEIKSNQAYIANTNTLCGSIAPMTECVKFFKEATGCSTVNALEAATLHPAQALEIHSQKGTLNFGADADFLLLNENLDLVSTWIAGECVYTKSNI
ncbi:N-acetylglucosamine-6-phosphate deacetylase isoform X2 [Cotesia typhae]|uniref:N-acetylglucosamine-6-phosphate deacetylase isoform X2 n=1 Tax=Cotesia typhae TaxID=2053667 RepID=UPI003D687942